ncbi:U-box domain-containing protein 4 [Hordeum vulgare]|nr:U-box domain-containing protein 4 [Hordeum vulgare]
MEQDKGKDVVPPSEVTPVQVPPTNNDVSEDPHSSKRQNYDHNHEEGGATHFCKVIMAPQLNAIPMPLNFTKHFLFVLREFKLKTNTDCSWRVTVRLLNDRVTLDQGWATFSVLHQIKIDYTTTFKLVTPNTLKVIVFNDDDIEVVTKRGRHDDAFVVNV